MATVESVLSCLVRVPLAETTDFATRSVQAREYVLVKVLTDDGGEGIGLTYAGDRAGSVVLAAVRDLLAPLLIGQDAYRVEGLWETLYRAGLLHGRTGSAMRALSALDIALWDRNARAAALPLWKFLGAYRTDSIPCYASGGYYRKGKTVQGLADEMATYVGHGFKAVKMKVGLLDLAQEQRRVAAAREAVGDGVLLMLDANNAWPDVATALPFVRAFEPFSPFWLEEPFSPDDLESHARLAEKTPISIASGEIEAGRWRFKDMMDRRAVGVLQTDALVCGGITEWRRIAAIASAYGIPVCPHAWENIHIHLAASVPNAPFVEFFPDKGITILQCLLDSELSVSDGTAALPSQAGLGFNFREETLSKFATSPWAER